MHTNSIYGTGLLGALILGAALAGLTLEPDAAGGAGPRAGGFTCVPRPHVTPPPPPPTPPWYHPGPVAPNPCPKGQVPQPHAIHGPKGHPRHTPPPTHHSSMPRTITP
jgi:hypothetical protein